MHYLRFTLNLTCTSTHICCFDYKKRCFLQDAKERVVPRRTVRFISNVHYLRFKSNMHNLRFILNLTCTTLGSRGVGGVEAKGGVEVSGRTGPPGVLLL